MKNTSHFIIVDDDSLNNALCQVIIKSTLEEAKVETFSIPEKAFAYIFDEFSENKDEGFILLDLNMPTMSGWEFLKEFERFDNNIKSRIKICLLSSSLDQRDIERASANKTVFDYIVKPLTKEIVIDISLGKKQVL